MNRFMVSLSRLCLCARLTSGILNGKRIKSLRIHKIIRKHFVVGATMNDGEPLDSLDSSVHCLIHKSCYSSVCTNLIFVAVVELRQQGKIKLDV